MFLGPTQVHCRPLSTLTRAVVDTPAGRSRRHARGVLDQGAVTAVVARMLKGSSDPISALCRLPVSRGCIGFIPSAIQLKAEIYSPRSGEMRLLSG